MTIDAVELDKTFRHCLFTDDELVDGKPKQMADAVMVEAVVNKFGFHAGRLQEAKEKVRVWLLALPHQFRRSEGGGWSFLIACVDEDGRQWGEHINMEQLFALGLALGLVTCPLPREVWPALPGGVPYYTVEDV